MKALILVVLASCALTSKARPLEIRYFSPELAAPPAKLITRASAPHAPLRLGRVLARGVPRDAIVHRDSAVEVGRYETLRWTEAPDAYVRRALGRALYDRGRPLDQAVGGAVATIDVEVVAFEEVRDGARRRGHVELRFSLHDDRVVLERGAVAISRDARGSDVADVVVAIGAALDAATAEIAERVSARLTPPCTTCVDAGSSR